MHAKVKAIARAVNRPGALFAPFDAATLIGNRTVCASASEYFAECVPEAALNLPFANILSGRDILAENRDAIPSLYCAPYGFVTIATDQCGDAISLDVSDGQVYLLSHEKYEEDGIHPGWNSDHTAFLPPLEVSRGSIIDTAEGSWASIEAFLDDCLDRLVTER